MSRSSTYATRLVVLLVVSLLAVAGLGPRFVFRTGAQTTAPTPTPVTLPFAVGIRLKEGKDADLVGANCTLCHTLKPIVTHDGFTPDQWAKEVQKMRETYGAPVDDAAAARIVTYLQTYYSAPPRSDAEFLLGIAASPAAGVATPAAPPAAATPVTASSSAGSSAVTLDLVDIAFQPKTFTLPANTPVTVTLHNTGVALHNFSIDALKISVDVAPGETTAVTINAPAGSYEYYCDVPGHKQAGMVGTMTVT